jgi:citrate synthase
MTRIPTLSPAFDWRSEGLDWPVTTDVGDGLAGVIAAETRVMWLDPSSGQLAYRGVPIEQLANQATFEDVAYLLIAGRTGNDDPDGLETFRAKLRSSRILPSEVTRLIRSTAPVTHPMRVLRAGMSAVGCHELSADDDLAGEASWLELRVVGQVASVVEHVARHRRGMPPSVNDRDCSLAEGVLAALNHNPPETDEVRALDLLWVLYAAHGLDAPTFTSMVVASCLADPYANIVAGLSALRGNRSGGAAQAVLDQLLALDDAAGGRRWVRRTLESGGTIAGFGCPTRGW